MRLTAVGFSTCPLIYFRGIIDTVAPVSIRKSNLRLLIRAATVNRGGSEEATATTTRSFSFPKEQEKRTEN